MSHAVGSLYDYDILLSVSEDAINRQLKLCYNHALVDNDSPPPTDIDGASATAPTSYLINHELCIHPNDSQGQPQTDIGLSAHIECPTVSLTTLGNFTAADQENDDHRTARVSIRMKQDSSAAPQDSILTYKNDGNASQLTVNGYMFSFNATLQKTEIENVNDELVKPSQAQDDPAKLHPDLESTLDAAQGGSQDVLVMAAFLKFDETQLVNTFTVQDESGSAVADDVVLTAFRDNVKTFYCGLKTTDGVATPENPFVLGYGVARKSQPASNDQKPYFIPMKIDITTTPGDDTYDKGTLNFCMLTYRDGSDQPRTIDTSTSPGVLDKSLLNQTKAIDHDGVMGFCQDIVFAKYVTRDIGQNLWIDANRLLNSPSEGFQQNDQNDSGNGITSWSRSANFSTNTASTSEGNWVDGRTHMDGFSTLNVTMSSELLGPTAQSTSGPLANDFKRTGSITIDVRTNITLHLETQGKVAGAVANAIGSVENAAASLWSDLGGSSEAPPTPPDTWNEQAKATLAMHYAFVLQLGAGDDGLWTVTRPDAASIPTFSNGKLDVTPVKDMSSIDANSYGAWSTISDQSNDFDAIWGSSANTGSMVDSLSLLGNDSMNGVANSLTGLTKEMGKTVIMPAGETFMFTGIDTDANGHLYSHVTLSHLGQAVD